MKQEVFFGYKMEKECMCFESDGRRMGILGGDRMAQN